MQNAFVESFNGSFQDELRRHAPKGKDMPEGETFLITIHGRPRSKKAFGNLFARWCDDAGISKRLHGVRKGLASILPEMGVSAYHIDVLLGQELGSEASKIYTRGARRRQLARDRNEQWSRIAWEENPPCSETGSSTPEKR